jgi:hypothetical protein
VTRRGGGKRRGDHQQEMSWIVYDGVSFSI